MTEDKSSAEEPEKPSDEEPQRDPDDEDSQKRSRLKMRHKKGIRKVLDSFEAAVPGPVGLAFTGVGLVGVVVVLLGWWWFHQPQVAVPNLVGMSRAAAEAQLKDKGLNLRLTYAEVSDRPIGTVLRTDPAVGTDVDGGTGINLILAVSPPAPPANGSPGTAPAPGAGQLNLQPYPYPQPYPQAYPYPPYWQQQPPPPQQQPQPQQPPPPPPPPVAAPLSSPPQVMLGEGRVDYPDRNYHNCATGYQFNFSQQIMMTQPGRVTYRWLRSDQTSSPVQYIDFFKPGMQAVTTWWLKEGKPGEKLVGWARIEIMTPQAGLLGKRIEFSSVCPVSPTPTPRPTPTPTPPLSDHDTTHLEPE